MTKQRANLGFGSDLDDFNPAEWQPKAPENPTPKLEPEVTRQAAQAAGFQSRQAAQDKPAPRQQRRRRTGRNVQFNIKAKPETIDAFCAIADAQGWGIGETLEKAVELLEANYSTKR